MLNPVCPNQTGHTFWVAHDYLESPLGVVNWILLFSELPGFDDKLFCISFMSKGRVWRKTHGVLLGTQEVPSVVPSVTGMFPDSILLGRLSSPTCRLCDPLVP